MNDRDEDMIVRTVMGEAGGESDAGKAAVASVILNRLKTGDYGKSATQVVLAPGQFEPWSTRSRELQGYSPKSQDYQATKAIVDGVISGDIADPTGGATHFYSPGMQAVMGRTTPAWAKGQPMAAIGHHVFYAPNGPAQDDLLSTWGQNPAPSAAPTASAGAQASDDLLSDWASKVAPASNAPTVTANGRLYVSPAKPDQPAAASPAPVADLPQIANLKAHQGDTFTDRAVRLGVGGLQGVEDVANTLARGIAATGEGGSNALLSAGVISPQTNQAVQDWATGVRQNVLEERNAFDQAAGNSPLASMGRVGGQIFATAPTLAAGEVGLGLKALTAARPVLGTLATGAAMGAGANALTSAASDEPLMNQIEGGALLGGGFGLAGRGASAAGAGLRNLFFGHVSPETAQLADAAINKYGIPVTAGQIAGNPLVRFTDSVLQRIPFTGYGARTEAQQSGLNSAIANEMGVSSNVVTPNVVKQAKRTAYTDYDAAKAKMTGTLSVDQPFLHDIINIRNNAGYNLEAGPLKQVERHLDNIGAKVDPNAMTLDVDQYQALTRSGGPLDNAINSRDSKISTYAQEIKDALENLVTRNNPALKKLKDEADYKYFVAKSVEPLANEAPTGNISPAKLLRALDYSETPAGEIGRIGQRFLKEPASSGTSERQLAMDMLKGGLGGALGLGGAYYFDPEHFQNNALYGGAALLSGVLASKTLRSELLTRGIINSALGRSGGSQKFGNLLARTAPLAALTYRGTGPANGLASQ